MTPEAQGIWLHYIHNQEAESDECPLPMFLLFIQSGTPAYGMVLPTFRTGLFTLVN